MGTFLENNFCTNVQIWWTFHICIWIILIFRILYIYPLYLASLMKGSLKNKFANMQKYLNNLDLSSVYKFLCVSYTSRFLCLYKSFFYIIDAQLQTVHFCKYVYILYVLSFLCSCFPTTNQSLRYVQCKITPSM